MVFNFEDFLVSGTVCVQWPRKKYTDKILIKKFAKLLTVKLEPAGECFGVLIRNYEKPRKNK
jgi:hypothetical protein